MEYFIKVGDTKVPFEGTYQQALNETKRLTENIGYFWEKGSQFKTWVDKMTITDFLKARKKLI